MSEEKLIKNIDSEIIKIRTKTLDVSFNELYDMYKNDELIISPKYQRLFRWSEDAQSRFIESLILEMPVPPIFVIEKEDGVYELIDGLQRISSYLHFRGENVMQNDNLDNDEDGEILSESTEIINNPSESTALQLKGCDIVEDLNGCTFASLPFSLKVKLKRSFVRMEVIKKESNQSLKYHMFKRLNTGGELLSDQEIRNCTIRLLGEKGINFIANCAEEAFFQKAISRIQKIQKKKMYDQELVLRFFAIKNSIAHLEDIENSKADFLTSYLEKMTLLEFDFEKEKNTFDKTFNFVSNNLPEDILSSRTRSSVTKNDLALYYFDGICIAISKYIEKINGKEETVKNCIQSAKANLPERYRTGSSYGIKGRIQYFSDKIANVLK